MAEKAGNVFAVHVSDLLEQIAAGQRQAFDELYELTAGRVFRLINAVLLDVAQSEEVSQEVYLQVWQRAPAFDRLKGSGSTWLFTMARFRAVDRVRHSQAARLHDSIYQRTLFVPIIDPVVEYISRLDNQKLLRAAFANLSAVQQQAVIMIYLNGYTHQAASQLLGIPLGTLKTRVRDALILLRTVLNPS